MTIDERAELVLYLRSGSYKTSDPWHSYQKGGETFYQWGIIHDINFDGSSHLRIIFETSDKVLFDSKRTEAESIIRSYGRGT